MEGTTVTVPKLVNLTDNRHIWRSGTLAIPQIWRFRRISTKFGTIMALPVTFEKILLLCYGF